ncbi:MAG: N-acetylmuramoyl-L-alanine amidase [Peptococcaceae bacterium]
MNINDVRSQLAQHPAKEYDKRPLDSIKYIAIHHSATKGGNAFSFARYHVNTNDWPGIGYHYVILEDGTVQWANDLTTVSYHVGEYNLWSVGICLVGDFTDGEPSLIQRQVLKELCQSLFDSCNLTNEDVKGHNELNPGHTLCPAVDMNQLRTDLLEEKIAIYVDGSLINVSGQLNNGITYVPLRGFATVLGYAVLWDDATHSVYLSKSE